MKNYKFVFLFMLMSYAAFANDISVTNVNLTGYNTVSHYAMVQFSISWEKSWRVSTHTSNWDAAWVFVKYKVTGETEWKHAWLNNVDNIAPAGSTIDIGLFTPGSGFNTNTNPGLGAFIYRNATGGPGANTFENVQLRWNYGANGVADGASAIVQVFAIEMVYVPQGNFYAGTGGSENGAFYKYPLTGTPYQITDEGQISVGTSPNYLYYPNTSNFSGDRNGPIPAAFPKGYNAFYCMKYEINQQGYVDFLNSLSVSQASNRFSASSIGYRYGITVTGGVYSTINPFVACNFLSWADLAAYLDWSGLRPMTELEFEKSCRGTQTAVAGEYVWGTTGITGSAYLIDNNGLTDEIISSNYNTTVGNASYLNTVTGASNFYGPLRVGIFAGTSGNNGRVTSGAAYYSIMEMSGNLWERLITVGKPEGRAFTGTHGNGMLDAEGNADALLWPDNTNAVGVGFRGGSFTDDVAQLQVSDRFIAAFSSGSRESNYGGRGVRTAP